MHRSVLQVADPQGCAQGVLGGVQGAESLFLWRAVGGAVLTLVPAIAYSLKVCPTCGAI